MKKFVSMLLLIAVLVSLCACAKKETAATTAPVAEPATEATLDPSSPEAMYGHIDQTKPVDGVYKIWNTDGIQSIWNHPEGNFELLCDLDMAGAELTPIAEFTGTINGGNFTIKNFTVKGGNETDFGFITVNKGKVNNLYLDNVTLIPGSNAKNIGLVGVNEGTVNRCIFSNLTLDVPAAAADASVGALAGYNAGTLSNNEVDVDVKVTAPGKVNVGGIAGTAKGGKIEYIDTIGALDATDCGNKSVGLFAGWAEDVILTGCAFVGASNTVDGKLFTNFTGNPDDDELVVALDALWRDNDKPPLTEGQNKLRDLVVAEMNTMGTIEWRLHQDLLHDCTCSLSTCHGVYNTTYTYYGIPYNHKGGSLSRMQYALDEDGYIKDWLYDMEAYDGFDLYIGNDCSTALAHAWWRVSNSTDFSRVTYQIPALMHSTNFKSGCIPVGTGWWEHVTLDSDKWTDDYFEANDEQTMLEAYALMRKGDAYGYMVEAGGHTRMAAEDAVVVRDQQGKINPSYSYVITTEQGATWTDDVKMQYSNWKVNFKYSFGSLMADWAVPMTCEELLTGEMEPAECTLLDGADGLAGIYTGTVKANYYLDSVNVTIKDSKGNQVMNHTMWTTVDKRHDLGHNDGLLRNYKDDFDLSAFAMPLSKVQLKKGETYTYTISGLLHTYDTFVVKEDSFTFGQA